MSDGCPKCGAARPPAAAECARCGVIFARLRPAAPARSTTVSARPDAGLQRSRPPEALTPGERERLLRGLGQGLRAGVSFPEAARLSAAGLPAAAAARLQEAALEGALVSEALGPWLDPAARGLLTAAERAGDLPAVLDLLADGERERAADRRSLLLGLAYPTLLLLSATVLLPLPALVDPSRSYLRECLPLFLPALGLAGAGVYLSFRPPAPGGRTAAALAGLADGLPLVSSIVRARAESRLASTLAHAWRAGLPARATLPLGARAAGMARYAALETRSVQALDDGASFAEALAAGAPFSETFLAQVRIAETTGALPPTLERLAEDARGRARARLLVLVGLLTGLTFAAMAALIGWQVVRGFLGYYEAVDRAGS